MPDSNPKRTKGDVAVIKAFLDRRPASSKKLVTDGQRLDGLWMGGSKIAYWQGDKIYMPDLGGKTSDDVQKAIRTFAARSDLARNPKAIDVSVRIFSPNGKTLVHATDDSVMPVSNVFGEDEVLDYAMGWARQYKNNVIEISEGRMTHRFKTGSMHGSPTLKKLPRKNPEAPTTDDRAQRLAVRLSQGLV